MSSKHTPGPWFAVNADLTIRARSEFGLSIATVTETVVSSDGTTETVMVDAATGEANALLIAAAPELLEALEGFVSCWDACSSPLEFVARARAAIAKATGAA